jgi:hypothetical protein
MPAGIVTLSFLDLRTVPVLPQSLQGLDGILPTPPQALHGEVIIMKPEDTTCYKWWWWWWSYGCYELISTRTS